jgi:cytochrome c553
MHMKKLTAMFLAFGLLAAPVAFATPASDTLLAKYKSEGAGKADPAKAKSDWTREEVVDGEKMSCATCHGNDFGKSGKHHRTGKVIEPMSMQVNAERYSEVKKIEKWFKRNCKDAWGRECTAQEKADFLTFLLAQ